MTTYITRLSPGPRGRRVAIKDLIDLAGTPTTAGSLAVATAATAAVTDAPCLAGIRAAESAGRLSIVGKTNLHELAFGVTGINQWFGTPVNPVDPRLIPGGSSSGSAVAVASGDADIALGSDTGGSVRIPAACCGIVGLKTTWGRVSLEGVFPLAPSLDTVGPLARDVAGVLEGMALLEPGFTADVEPAGTLGRVRLPADEAVDAALDVALAVSGLPVVEVPLPGWEAANQAALTVMAAEAWAVNAALARDRADMLGPDVASRLAAAATLPADEAARARAGRARWEAELAEAFRRADLLVLPTLAVPTPKLSEALKATTVRYTAPVNFAGIPALALPVPTRSTPVGLQLLGPRGSEDRLLATGRLLEAAARTLPRRVEP